MIQPRDNRGALTRVLVKYTVTSVILRCVLNLHSLPKEETSLLSLRFLLGVKQASG